MTFPEQTAAAIFGIAIRDGRAAELLMHLFDGGGVTLDTSKGVGYGEVGIILIPAAHIQQLAEEA